MSCDWKFLYNSWVWVMQAISISMSDVHSLREIMSALWCVCKSWWCSRWPFYLLESKPIQTWDHLLLGSRHLKSTLFAEYFIPGLTTGWMDQFIPSTKVKTEWLTAFSSLVLEEVQQISNLLWSLKMLPQVLMRTSCIWGVFSPLYLFAICSPVFSFPLFGQPYVAWHGH